MVWAIVRIFHEDELPQPQPGENSVAMVIWEWWFQLWEGSLGKAKPGLYIADLDGKG